MTRGAHGWSCLYLVTSATRDRIVQRLMLFAAMIAIHVRGTDNQSDTQIGLPQQMSEPTYTLKLLSHKIGSS